MTNEHIPVPPKAYQNRIQNPYGLADVHHFDPKRTLFVALISAKRFSEQAMVTELHEQRRRRENSEIAVEFKWWCRRLVAEDFRKWCLFSYTLLRDLITI